MHNIQGRNFLHKYRQAFAAVPKPHGLTKCASEDRAPTHENVAQQRNRSTRMDFYSWEAVGLQWEVFGAAMGGR
jgi:hypothetical protein